MAFVPLARKSTDVIAIYREHTEKGDFIWYFCEDGSEVGRKLNAQSPIGYDYDIPYNEKNKARILKLNALAKLYHKNIQNVKSVSEEEF